MLPSIPLLPVSAGSPELEPAPGDAEGDAEGDWDCDGEPPLDGAGVSFAQAAANAKTSTAHRSIAKNRFIFSSNY